MEETIGYEALFSPEEWDSLDPVSDEEALTFSDVGPDGEPIEQPHTCTIYDPPGQYAGDETKFDVECDLCGDVGSAETESEAKAIARLHEAFVATLVENWSVDR